MHESNAIIRKQFTVSGKVQGVWFRASTREQALVLGLSGYVRNISDGRVQVEAQGNIDVLDKLEQWLQHGPPMAKVSGVEYLKIALKSLDSGFQIF